ncbi:hypothetical protein BDV25DRAFT_154387 [Aspergillus avenaceus]|uniref:Uncharacterized protein n=1 Tax=Aspergillus avenaceus TaxID=36643 RepID=A0A5N6TVM1_ASPAV|nr:hypothetical protein BDV25DRAFT_154387 [Aspergillus avenaceus]
MDDREKHNICRSFVFSFNYRLVTALKMSNNIVSATKLLALVTIVLGLWTDTSQQNIKSLRRGMIASLALSVSIILSGVVRNHECQ